MLELLPELLVANYFCNLLLFSASSPADQILRITGGT